MTSINWNDIYCRAPRVFAEAPRYVKNLVSDNRCYTSIKFAVLGYGVRLNISSV